LHVTLGSSTSPRLSWTRRRRRAARLAEGKKMTDVVDFLKFKARRRQGQNPTSALHSCLLHDSLVDLTAVVEALTQATSKESMNLTPMEQDQLEYLALIADDFLVRYEELGFNLVE
jgi:hypothetical protein